MRRRTSTLAPSGFASSIRRRLLVLLLPSLFALMLAGVLVNYHAAMLLVSSVHDKQLEDAVRGLAARAIVTGPGGAPRIDLSPATGAVSSAQRLGIALYSIRGPGGALLAGDSRLLPAPADSSNPSLAHATLQGQDYRVATYRFGLTAISVAEPQAVRAGAVHFILVSTWLVDFIQVDVTLLLVWIAVHYGLRPLLALRRQIESRSPRDLEPLAVSAVPSEVRPLVDTLNLLFEMLQEAARSQRQFVADTAHQLRTPLAGLMGHLELLMQDPGAAPPVRQRLAQLHDAMSRLAHSANQLLALARADHSAARGVEGFESVELASLVGKVVALNLDRAADGGHDLGAEVAPATIHGNPRLLEDLLANLVDNALLYTPSGGHITVRSGTARGKAFLEVEDDGPGIPESERVRVRQRFYRIAHTAGHGCGLGLAIVDEIARAHDAVTIIESGEGGRGTRVRVDFSLPIATQRAASGTGTIELETVNDVAV